MAALVNDSHPFEHTRTLLNEVVGVPEEFGLGDLLLGDAGLRGQFLVGGVAAEPGQARQRERQDRAGAEAHDGHERGEHGDAWRRTRRPGCAR